MVVAWTGKHRPDLFIECRVQSICTWIDLYMFLYLTYQRLLRIVDPIPQDTPEAIRHISE